MSDLIQSFNPHSNESNGAESAEQFQLTLIKLGHRFCFRYGPGDEFGMLQQIGQMAQDPQSELCAMDALVLSRQIGRNMASKKE